MAARGQTVRLKVKSDRFRANSELANSMILETLTPSPITVCAKEIGLEGDIPPSKMEQRINLVKWSRQKEVKEAWDRLAEREGSQKDPFEKAAWGFLDFIFGRSFDVVGSMSKAREMGWTG